MPSGQGPPTLTGAQSRAHARDMTHEGIDVLDRSECYTLLRTQRLGRVGVKLANELLILPVYYALLEDDIVFRTSPGTKLDAAVLRTTVAFEVDNETRANHPNIRTDAMFPPKAFRALVELVEEAAERHIVNGKPEEVYEPLDHIEPGLPRTLIHVSGSEVLVSDARKAAHMLAAAGVPVEVRVWPGQMHVFQIAYPMVSEASRSLKQIGDYIREATW